MKVHRGTDLTTARGQDANNHQDIGRSTQHQLQRPLSSVVGEWMGRSGMQINSKDVNRKQATSTPVTVAEFHVFCGRLDRPFDYLTSFSFMSLPSAFPSPVVTVWKRSMNSSTLLFVHAFPCGTMPSSLPLGAHGYSHSSCLQLTARRMRSPRSSLSSRPSSPMQPSKP